LKSRRANDDNRLERGGLAADCKFSRRNALNQLNCGQGDKPVAIKTAKKKVAASAAGDST